MATQSSEKQLLVLVIVLVAVAGFMVIANQWIKKEISEPPASAATPRAAAAAQVDANKKLSVAVDEAPATGSAPMEEKKPSVAASAREKQKEIIYETPIASPTLMQ